MRSGGNNFNYFPENKLIKLANFVQFICMLIFCPEDWEAGPPGPPLGGIVFKPCSDRIDYTVVCFVTHDYSRKL